MTRLQVCGAFSDPDEFLDHCAIYVPALTTRKHLWTGKMFSLTV